MRHANRLRPVLPVLLVLGCACWAAAAAGPASRPARPTSAPSGLRGEWAIMASEVQLTDDQKAKLEALVKAHTEAMAAWEKENDEKLKAARESKDANMTKALEAAREELRKGLRNDVTALLTDDQKVKWECFQLFRIMMENLRRASPAVTDEEKTAIRALCDASAKEIAGLKDEKEIRDAREKLRAKVLDLLTAEQRDSLKRPPQTQPEK